MPKLSEVKPDSRFFGMFIGRSSSGKSSAAISFPKPMKIFDFDMRARGPKAYADSIGLDVSGVSTEVYLPSGGFKKINDELEVLQMQFKNGRPYETIQFSSLGALLRILLSEARVLAGEGKTKKTGVLVRPGPNEYGYESEGIYQIFDYLRTFPCNVIIDAHIIDRFGKEDSNDAYSETIVTGEKLAVRDKIGENLLVYFDEVYRFEKDQNGRDHYVNFHTDMARSAFNTLPRGQIKITGKNFYEMWQGFVTAASVKTGT